MSLYLLTSTILFYFPQIAQIIADFILLWQKAAI